MAGRQYELVYILPPDSTEQQVAEVHEQVASVVARLDGQIETDLGVKEACGTGSATRYRGAS